ncbi:MAG TPA: hypothetical protein V6D23_13715 [Candidatus Obscuribacterales bacterium]
MSQASAYFILAQLNSIMTGCLRLGLALLGLALLAGWLSLWWPRWLRLGAYFSAWVPGLALVALGAACAANLLLPQPNPFISNGLWLAVGLLPAAALLLALQRLRAWQNWAFRLAVCLAGSAALALSILLPAFSRSNQILLSVLLDLPMAVALVYFPLLLLPQARARYAGSLHLLWGLGASASLLIHYLWLWPQLAGIPQEGEFYPFINLYDWFLFAAMILYLGNLYIDYWLKWDYPRSWLALSWNYLVMVASVLCLWLNANIFDTLAL